MNTTEFKVTEGDCLDELKHLDSGSVDLVYLDPPFFTNKHHSLVTRDRSTKFSFQDIWKDSDAYSEFLMDRLCEVKRLLKPTGSIFVHCDHNANYVIRAILDKVFGCAQFRSEIIWAYKRWSNSSKGLLPAHQTIFFYSRSDDFKFHTSYCSYSSTTNIDQILQLRTRDAHGVSSYATDENGNTVFGANKAGVPLSDVWEIPFLNPKARERVGYPTQKPVLLMERIIGLCTDPGDVVLDPFCGSGTTLVAAKFLGRRGIGIDSSSEAVRLTEQRLLEPIRTESALLQKGSDAYLTLDRDVLSVLKGLDIFPVQRNAGIDAFLKAPIGGAMVPVRVQRKGETLVLAAQKLIRAAVSREASRAFLIRTHMDADFFGDFELPEFVVVVDATALRIKDCISKLQAEIEATRSSVETLTPHNSAGREEMLTTD